MAELAPKELFGSLASIVGGKRVSIVKRDREVYARDMWPRLLINRRQGGELEHLPHAVVWPESEREVAAVIRYANKQGIAVIPYGGGSGVCGGVVPLRGGITIDLKRMDAIQSISREELVTDVQAGANGERFERELRSKGYTLGHFPSSIYCSTVGGWLACRAAGQLSTKYGKIEDRVVGLTFVTGKGEVIKTDEFARARRGPDWTQLIVGSEGCLGIITSARLRISPAPEITVLRGFEFDNVQEGTRAIRKVMQRGLKPAVVRLYDEVDTFINHISIFESHSEEALETDGLCPWPTKDSGALPALPTPGGEGTRKSGGAGERAMGLGRKLASRIKHGATAAALARPKLVNSTFGALANTVSNSGCKMIIGLEGPRLRTEVEAQLTFAAIERAGGRDEGEEPGLRWLAHRYAVSYKMSPLFREGGFVDTMEVASTWERLPDLYESVKAAIAAHAVVMAHFSHAYADGCSIYFSFAGRAEGLQETQNKYDEIWRAGMAAATRVGGTISHHHGIGLLKGQAMHTEHRESMTLFRALKNTFDPNNIMNPGKMGLPLHGEMSIL
ncbi:MAG: FAD-binding oxidoreductase [Myxococcales bacterium]|nr:FAD-binding oxidoreductase [Myxococcales bacterium]